MTTDSVTFHNIHIDSKGSSIFNDIKTYLAYLKLFKKITPDVILSYTIKPNIFAGLAGNYFGISRVSSITGLGTVYIKPSILTKITDTLYKIAFKNRSIVVFENKDDRAEFLNRKLVASSQTRTVPGAGIDLNHFREIPKSNTKQKVKFLFLGRVLGDKGINEYINAAKNIISRNSEVEFGILGFVSSENRSGISKLELDKMIAGFEQIYYHGVANDVRPYIAEADCIVLPSYREGTPRALLEASAMCKPIIATDVPGCREVVEDGVNGYFCDAKSYESLAQKIQKFLLLDDNFKRQLGKAGREKIRNEFSDEIVIAHYKKFIVDSLNS